MKRNCDGSHKEFEVYEQIMDTVLSCNSLISDEFLDTKGIMQNLDFIIKSINELQKRTFVNYFN